MRDLTKLFTAAALIATVSSCGETTSDRALSGGGIGAATGAVGSSILGGDPVTGAVLGGAVGAATGAATKSKDIDLGRPAWRR